MIPPLDTIHHGDVLEVLRTWPDAFVQCVVTSPPYWGLRDYGVAGQIGLEKTPEEFVAKMVDVFREVRRVLRDDGTLWLNLGDSYTSGGRSGHGTAIGYKQETNRSCLGVRETRPGTPAGLKEKDLIGIPWRVALALQADGWYLRSDIIWAKRNCMPESVTDRPTRAHEYIFLMTKSPSYFYDAESIREPSQDFTNNRTINQDGTEQIRKAWKDHKGRDQKKDLASWGSKYGSYVPAGGRNKRSWWPIATQPFPEAHFATFPPEIPETCIMAGTSEWGTCGECGAPADRVVESSRTFESGSGKSGRPPEGKNGSGMQGGGQTRDVRRGPVLHTKTTGWQLPCECASKMRGKCVVLDPFMGAGTTALAAAKLNRHFLGIELNPEYIKIAQRRIAGEVAQGKLI